MTRASCQPSDADHKFWMATPTKPMPIGDGKEFTLFDWTMTASNDAGIPF